MHTITTLLPLEESHLRMRVYESVYVRARACVRVCMPTGPIYVTIAKNIS